MFANFAAVIGNDADERADLLLLPGLQLGNGGRRHDAGDQHWADQVVGDGGVPGAWMAGAGIVGLVAVLLIERRAQAVRVAQAHA